MVVAPHAGGGAGAESKISVLQTKTLAVGDGQGRRQKRLRAGPDRWQLPAPGRLTSPPPELRFAPKVREQTLSSGAWVKMSSTFTARRLAPPKCAGPSDFACRKPAFRNRWEGVGRPREQAPFGSRAPPGAGPVLLAALGGPRAQNHPQDMGPPTDKQTLGVWMRELGMVQVVF